MSSGRLAPYLVKGFRMSSSPRSRRAGAVVGVAGLAALALTGVASAASANAASTTNPYSPAYGHPYRHGVLPTIGTQQKMNHYTATHPNVVTATGPETLSYGGGIDGIGVQSGHSKVYLVFYGTQWGTSSTDANGNLKFTGDSAGAAGVTQQMFKGIGTNGELWSADLTQWCDGAGVASGAVACPASGASYIPYQSGGVLAGVWYDNSAASPSAATSLQLGQEAIKAAGHFGNTTAASNRYSYYVILSPHGTNPDNYQGQYCAWHDWNGDVGASSSYGDIAFSNQPYNIDSGAGCGVGFVNSPGTTDGFTMTLGHEWHEMMSDQNPAGGWTNHTGSSYNGQENSDECAWISPGQAGGAANISFGSFGTYAEQASWSNDTNACAISHPIVNHGGSGPGPANLAVNGGFESGAGSWSVEPGTNFVAYQSGQIAGESARSGSFYGATNTSAGGGGIYQDVSVSAVAGNVYCASAWVRTQYPSTGASGKFVVWLLGGSSTENGVVNFSGLGNAGNWQQVQTCVSATTGHTALRIQFYPTINGPTVDIDDIDVH